MSMTFKREDHYTTERLLTVQVLHIGRGERTVRVTMQHGRAMAYEMDLDLQEWRALVRDVDAQVKDPFVDGQQCVGAVDGQHDHRQRVRCLNPGALRDDGKYWCNKCEPGRCSGSW